MNSQSHGITLLPTQGGPTVPVQFCPFDRISNSPEKSLAFLLSAEQLGRNAAIKLLNHVCKSDEASVKYSVNKL